MWNIEQLTSIYMDENIQETILFPSLRLISSDNTCSIRH